MNKAHGKVYGELLLLCNYCLYKVIAKDLGMEDKRVSRSWDLPRTLSINNARNNIPTERTTALFQPSKSHGCSFVASSHLKDSRNSNSGKYRSYVNHVDRAQSNGSKDLAMGF